MYHTCVYIYIFARQPKSAARARKSVTLDPTSGGRAAECESFIDNLLVRIHCIIVMIRWIGLAP